MQTQNWFMKNITKITLVLATVGAVSGLTALIVGSIGVNQSTKFSYYETPNHVVVWGNTTIWWNKVVSAEITNLYFAAKKNNTEDVKWDGTYTVGYFKN